jgi:tetratricopeptide (TPR) repeat protein
MRRENKRQRPVRPVLYAGLLVTLGVAGVVRWQWERARLAREHDRQGMALFREGNLEAAAGELRQEIALAPGRAVAYYSLGLIELQRGRPQAARETLSRAMALRVEQPQAPCALGLATYRMSDYSAAVAPLQQCLARNPEDEDARYLLAQSFLGQARLDEAEAQFRELLTRQPGNGRALYALGTVYLFRPSTPANNAAALTVLQGATAREDAPAGAFYSLGLVYRRLGRWREAAASLEQAVRRDPELLEARRTLGLVYRRLGRGMEAKQQFQAVRSRWEAAHRDQHLAYLRDEAQRNPTHPMTHYQLGCLYQELGQFAGARSELETALQLDPTLPEARERLSALSAAGSRAPIPARGEADRPGRGSRTGVTGAVGEGGRSGPVDRP